MEGGRRREEEKEKTKKGETDCPYLHSVLLFPLHFFSALTCTSDLDFLSDSDGLSWLLYKLVHLLWSLSMRFTSAILKLFLSSNCPLLATVSKKTMCPLLRKWGMALGKLPSCPLFGRRAPLCVNCHPSLFHLVVEHPFLPFQYRLLLLFPLSFCSGCLFFFPLQILPFVNHHLICQSLKGCHIQCKAKHSRIIASPMKHIVSICSIIIPTLWKEGDF